MYIETNTAEGTGDRAIANLLAPLDNRAPDLLVLSCSCEFDVPELNAAVAQVGAHAFHGSTSCLGVMANGGMSGRAGDGIGYFALWDTDGAYGTACAGLDGDATAAASQATKRALDRAGRPGEAPHLIWVSASPGQEEAVIAGIESVVGSDIPIVGGSAADNTVEGNWAIFGVDGLQSDGVQITVLFPSTPLVSEFQSGYAPSGKSALVTRADGRRLYELDNRPAADVYAELSGLGFDPDPDGAPVSILSQSSFNPLGFEMGDVSNVPYYLLMHAAVLHDDKSIEFFADIKDGARLHVMDGAPEGLKTRAGRVALRSRERIESAGGKLAGALVIYCAGCMLSITDLMGDVADGVHQNLEGAPFLGIFTFGEQGYALNSQNSHGNLMISCVTFTA